jgi:TRAP-type C4-dicarboxylate transport system substrate-binding protein
MKIVALLLALVSTAQAQRVLRFASVAPEGSPWARELVAFGNEVQNATHGALRIKWYFNAIAGDEMEELARIKRGQLDGAASGQIACEQLAPSLRISHLPGVFQDRAEASSVIWGLQPTLDKEAHEAGFLILAVAGLGPSVFFARTPVRSMAELKRVRLWRWNLDEVGIAASRAMGLDVLPESLHAAGRAYDDKKIDGFLGIPSAALAFQWSAQAKVVIDLRPDYLFGCLLIPERTSSSLPVEQQAALREAAAKLRARYEELGRGIDERLLGGLFEKQGMTVIPVSPAFRAEFFAAARAARESIAGKFVSKDLLARVQVMLADYRAEHRGGASP